MTHNERKKQPRSRRIAFFWDQQRENWWIGILYTTKNDPTRTLDAFWGTDPHAISHDTGERYEYGTEYEVLDFAFAVLDEITFLLTDQFYNTIIKLS